jgi:two-component system, OmpR family, response regulator
MTQKRRVLVVEDQPLVAETIASALCDDYDVVCGSSAGEALVLLEGGGCDLVLLDCLLPGGRATDVMAQADAARVPIILMSGDLQRMEQLSDGDRPFLSKPFSLVTLMRTVQAALSKSG